jgi:hypothetical protein
MGRKPLTKEEKKRMSEIFHKLWTGEPDDEKYNEERKPLWNELQQLLNKAGISV